MTGVDVLAWFGPCEGNTPNDRAAREIRDAVAELIDADRDYDRAETEMIPHSGYTEAHLESIRKFRSASDRRRAALARVTGAQA